MIFIIIIIFILGFRYSGYGKITVNFFLIFGSIFEITILKKINIIIII